MTHPLLKVDDLSISYATESGWVRAVRNVSLTVNRHEIFGLVGESGCGKSTLAYAILGDLGEGGKRDTGRIFFENRDLLSLSSQELRRLRGAKIAMVHQELAFCPNLTVAENLCLGDLPQVMGFLDRSAMRNKARAMLREIEANIDVDRLMGTLSTGQEQLVQIAGALGVNARVIVMDEPTSSLSAHESEHLFKLLAVLKSRRITVIYVSHRMEEIFRLCDTVTVLRDGHHVATEKISDTNRDRMIHQMVGREIKQYTSRHLDNQLGPELLRVENLSSPGKFKDVSFRLHAGEVLGFAGLVGAGRSEVAQAIFGLDPRATGRVFVRGREIPLGSVSAASSRPSFMAAP